MKSPTIIVAVNFSLQFCQRLLHILRYAEVGCTHIVMVNFTCRVLHSSLCPGGDSAELYWPLLATPQVLWSSCAMPSSLSFSVVSRHLHYARSCQCSKTSKLEATPPGSCRKMLEHWTYGLPLPRENLRPGSFLPTTRHCAKGGTMVKGCYKFSYSFDEADFMVTRGAWDLNQLPNFSQKELVCVLLNGCLGEERGSGVS